MLAPNIGSMVPTVAPAATLSTPHNHQSSLVINPPLHNPNTQINNNSNNNNNNNNSNSNANSHNSIPISFANVIAASSANAVSSATFPYLGAATGSGASAVSFGSSASIASGLNSATTNNQQQIPNTEAKLFCGKLSLCYFWSKSNMEFTHRFWKKNWGRIWTLIRE